METREIHVGQFYLKKDGSDVRQVLSINDGNVFWQGYNYRDGSPHTNFTCSLGYFATWAGRKLSEDEQARMQVNRAFDKLQEEERRMQQIALASTSNDDLPAEVRKRGLIE